MNRPRVRMAGTWDPDFHRNRGIIRLLERGGFEIQQCRVDLWSERGPGIVGWRLWSLLGRAMWAYPRLVWRFLTMPRPEVVLIPYPGHFDVPLLAVLSRLLRIPLLFDPFISLYDTVVADRALTAPDSMLAKFVGIVDRWACRAADLTLADTPEHARYLSRETGVPLERFRVLPVGAEENLFRPRSGVDPDPKRVLFYGTFIPLHGMETIMRAAAALEPEGIRVRIVGDGQERPTVDRLQAELGVENVDRVDWIPLNELPDEIARAGICLGIFGTTGKADRVVPNKVYQCMAVGRPVVTGDTRAVRTAFDEGEVVTVPVGDPSALADAVRTLSRDADTREAVAARGHRRFLRDYGEGPRAERLVAYISDLTGGQAN